MTFAVQSTAARAALPARSDRFRELPHMVIKSRIKFVLDAVRLAPIPECIDRSQLATELLVR
jgi:hypothetical protein